MVGTLLLVLLLFGAVAAVPIAGFAFYVWARLRRERHRPVLALLRAVVAQNLPLLPAIRAAAAAERGGTQRRLDTLADALDHGFSLSTALRLAYPMCAPEAIGRIRAGEQAGTLPSVLRDAPAPDAAADPPGDTLGKLLVYNFLLLCFLCLSLAMLSVTAGKFRELAADYSLPIPPTLAAFYTWLDRSLSGGWVFAGLAACLALGLQLFFGRQFLIRMPERLQQFYRRLDRLVWRLPLAHRLVATRALAHQFPIVQASLAAGHDLPAALRHAACADANELAQNRLLRWADLAEQTGDAAQAATACGLPNAVRAALAAPPEHLSARFGYLALYYRSLAVHWERTIVRILAPLNVIAWAALVGALILATVWPIVLMIEHLVESS